MGFSAAPVLPPERAQRFSAICSANTLGALSCKAWCGPHVIVILTPAFELVTLVGQREEDFDAQALVTEPAVERFDIDIFDPPARPDKSSRTPK
jgi:hypothetical protein